MTQKEKRKYMNVALRIIGVNVTEKYSAIIVEIYEVILRYEGNVNLQQIIAIENRMEYEYKKDKN
jgi:hypothetical protein